MRFHVIIIGGGIAGLCLAQGLRKAGISIAVYEKGQINTDKVFGIHSSPLAIPCLSGNRNGLNLDVARIRDNVTRMRQEWEAQRGALATVRRFNATLSAKGYVWFWPKIAAAPAFLHQNQNLKNFYIGLKSKAAITPA